jgi:hypothetical protein
LIDDLILPSILGQDFNEVLVVGQHHSGEGYRHLPVPTITGTTNDALIKRDVGLAATTSEYVVFLSDDHRLDPFFCIALRDKPLGRRSIGVPTRITNRGPNVIPLPMGFEEGYCGGHGMVVHRTAIQEVPFTVAPHHPNWDVLHSQMLTQRGYELVKLDDCLIEDVEENAQPWR